MERGRESKLHIANVTYDYQGEYVCKVTNVISGIERTVQSEAIALQVVGEGPATCFMSMINITVCVCVSMPWPQSELSCQDENIKAYLGEHSIINIFFSHYSASYLMFPPSWFISGGVFSLNSEINNKAHRGNLVEV